MSSYLRNPKTGRFVGSKPGAAPTTAHPIPQLGLSPTFPIPQTVEAVDDLGYPNTVEEAIRQMVVNQGTQKWFRYQKTLFNRAYKKGPEWGVEMLTGVLKESYLPYKEVVDSACLGIMWNPKTEELSDEQYDNLLTKISTSERYRVGEALPLSQSMLSRLASSPAGPWTIVNRKSVLPYRIQRDVSRNDLASTRSLLGRREDLDPRIALYLSGDVNPHVRVSVVENNSVVLTPLMLTSLVVDDSASVRKALTQRKNLPSEMWTKLANDSHTEVREGVASSPYAPDDLRVLARLSIT